MVALSGHQGEHAARQPADVSGHIDYSVERPEGAVPQGKIEVVGAWGSLDFALQST
jgi:hypothetical protein